MSIFETVKKTLAALLEINPELITRDTKILDDLGADSLDLVELVMSLEERYNIVLSSDSKEEVKTVGQIVDFIEAELK